MAKNFDTNAINASHREVNTPSSPESKNTKESTISLDVQTEKSIYQIGENLILSVKSTNICYLTIFDIAVDGSITRIFPNNFKSDNKLQGGETYMIPAKSDHFDLQFTDPAGTEHLHVICTVEKMILISEKLIGDSFARFIGTSQEFKETLD